MRKSLLATMIAGMFLSLPAHAADLLQLYKEALANDSVYASASAVLAAGEEKEPQGRAGLGPTIALSGGYNKTNYQMQSPTALTTSFFANSYTLSLTQPLFRWDNWELFEQSKLSVAISQAQFAQAQQDLIVRVSQAYFDVLTAQDALSALQAQQTAITEQLAAAKRSFELGAATITDTHEAQARYDLAVAQVLAAKNDLRVKLIALKQIIGKPPGDLAILRTGVQLNAPTPLAMEPWIESAEQQNYTVIAQKLALEVARRDINKSRAGHAPTLELVANRNHTNQSGAITSPLNGNTYNASMIGIQWNMPIFSSFAVTSKVRESIALEDKARNDLETARRTASQNASQAYLGVSSGLEQVKALEAGEASSKLALRSNKLGYEVGVRINIDVLNAQQQVYSTQKDLAKARYDTIMNGLRLKAAAGTLKEEDVAEVNALLTQNPISATPSEK
ncbi:MAG: TolC family outer membrane protein [Burkholderiaceae bacterium]